MAGKVTTVLYRYATSFALCREVSVWSLEYANALTVGQGRTARFPFARMSAPTVVNVYNPMSVSVSMAG